MKVSQAIQSFRQHHRLNSKKNTLKNYEFIFTRFHEAFSDRQIKSIPTDDVLAFLGNGRNLETQEWSLPHHHW